MPSQPWHRWWSVIGASSLLLPPLGLLLLWARKGTGVGVKLLGSIAILAVTAGILHIGFGFRLQVDGSGWRPRFATRGREAHDSALERNRARQRARDPEPTARRAAAPVDAGPATAPLSGMSRTSRTTPAETAAPEPVGTPRDDVRAYWSDFRGPKRDGRYEASPILTTWPEYGLRLLWRQPVGGGYASFVAAGGRLFTIEQRRQQEVLASYDLETGREHWSEGWDADFREAMGGDGPRATPTWDGGRVYGLGATGALRCVDAETGELLWERNILSENGARNIPWAMSASPLIVDDKVIVLPGGAEGRSIVAYDKMTGERIWSALDDRQAYTSPMLVTLAGRRQILVVSARRAMGVTVDDGTLLWEYPWTTSYDANIAQPVLLGQDRVFLSAGYGHGAAVFEVRRTGESFSTRARWENIRMKNKFTSSILHEGYLYGLDEAILACVDAETGELMWKGGRYGHGQVVFGSGHLIVLTEGGDLVLVEATPERHAERARFPAISGKSWNHPIIADGRLVVRNTTEMAAFDISVDGR